jgi:iduronate 2-sulfatase
MRRLLYFLLSAFLPLSARAERPNVLLIVADDLRCDIAASGHPEALTPNLNRLAARSRVFTRAYCQQAVCNPSRASMMTGLRPDQTRVTDLRTHFRETLPGITTLSQHFKTHGYEAVGIGKIYHNYHLSIEGDPASWSQPQRFHWGNHRMDQPQAAGHKNVPFARLPATQAVDVADAAYMDGRIADAAVAAMAKLKDKPFFLAAGFWKPHLPYNAPKKYWDLYDRAKLTRPDHPGRPQGAPDLAIHASPEPRGYHGIPAKGDFSDETIMELRHGYLAAVSYLDANIGKLLDALDRNGLAGNTIIVFWSDNGYHLGENAMFGKLTNFERDTRVPMMIATPGLQQPGPTASIVEMVDLYPTLADLCQIPAPPHQLDGVSLRPLLDSPTASVKHAAISQHPDDLSRPTHMGYSVRTAEHRYNEWRSLERGTVTARELYQYDGRLMETRNLADAPASAALIARLAPLLPVATARPTTVSASSPPPPGTVIHHSPAASGRYIGSPSICRAPNGDYLACHDLFGPKSNEHVRATGRLYRSSDKGKTWQHLTDFDGFFWTGLFVHQGHVYTLGNDKHHGNVVIRRSTDSGRTWTPPVTIAEGQFHSAPMPVVEHDGRLWRAMEDAHTSNKWGERYRARMMSAPAGSDLLDPRSWTLSNAIARQTEWLPDGFSAWLEGNAVADPGGNLVNILRVDHSKLPEKAAIVRISKDGKTATFDPEKGIVDFPGGSKKFTIRKDPAGPGYWSLASIVPERHAGQSHPAATRNTLALLHSDNLIDWEIRSVLLYHPDTVNHGFQYVDWQFEGDAIIAACRTAWDDDQGGARNNHDANFLTFHRWENFRQLTRQNDIPMPRNRRGSQ